MKNRINILLGVLIAVCSRVGWADENTKPTLPDSRLRVVVTTDGEVDDRCSMNRFLLYTNDWDVCGIIHSSSKYLGANHSRLGLGSCDLFKAQQVGDQVAPQRIAMGGVAAELAAMYFVSHV